MPEFISVALTPVIMVGIAAALYKIAKQMTPRHIAARLAFVVPVVLFALNVATIGYLDLAVASAFATLVGALILVMLLRKRAAHG